MRICFTAFLLMGACISQAAPIAGIDIIGTTLGCFGASCAPVALSTFGGLTFTGGAFSGATDANGEFAPGVVGDNFGVFSLDGTVFNYGAFATPTPFTLEVVLTAPAPGLPLGHVFTAGVAGIVSSNTNGTVSVTWPNICHGCGFPPVFLYNFNVIQGSGTIAVHINPLSLSLAVGTPGPQSAIQDAHFHTDVIPSTPEPAVFGLLGSGLLALGLMRKRINTL